jgi:prevent-host-death family protein
MTKRVSATQARVQFGEILRTVQEDGETIVVERDGHAAAVILPVAAYERLGDEARSPNWRARIAALHGLWESELGRRRLPDASR